MKRTVVYALLMASPALAGAQTLSDVMPAPAPAPAGSTGGVYLPGMPVPQPTVTRQAPPPTSADAPPARKGLDLVGEDNITGGSHDFSRDSAEYSVVDRNAEMHTVRKGDTLWSVAGAYLGSPWQWPKLWALNPSITNPHWIFPGDVLRLRNGDLTVATPPPSDPKTGPRLSPRPQTVSGLMLRQTGFVEPKELEAAGKILASKEEKVMLATDDEAYVEFKKGNAPRVGEMLTIYRPDRVMKHPTSGKKLGYVVEVYSDAEVLSVQEGKLAKIKLKDTVTETERGMRVGPMRRQFKIVESKKSGGTVEGVIVDTLQLAAGMVGQDMLVFLDRGRNAGLDVGNRLLVTRRGDGYVPLLSKGPIDDKKYPRETIGEILIVDVREGLATGVVTKSTKEARIGDRVETRSGM